MFFAGLATKPRKTGVNRKIFSGFIRPLLNPANPIRHINPELSRSNFQITLFKKQWYYNIIQRHEWKIIT